MSNFNPEWLLRLVCAVAIGSAIGYERFSSAKEAGIRTHAVVALSSCLLMIISQYGFPGMERYDAARVAAQAVSGIGFLGAGIIFVRYNAIQGLSTAAGMWATCAIGLAIGCGMYVLGIFSGVMVFLIQGVLQKVLPYYAPRNVLRLLITIKKESPLDFINDTISDFDYHHAENRISADEDGNMIVEAEISTHRDYKPIDLINELKKHEEVLNVRIK